jgi:hypothetical protein
MLCQYAECHSSECRHAECHYAECRYAECHYTECHGAIQKFFQKQITRIGFRLLAVLDWLTLL